MTLQMHKPSLFSALLRLASPVLLALPAKAATFDYGETAVETINYLSENLEGRSVGTPNEAKTVDYLVQQLK